MERMWVGPTLTVWLILVLFPAHMKTQEFCHMELTLRLDVFL